MSPRRGWLTPEARATLEAVWAKLAAPGMCNPATETPCVDGPPTQEAIDTDTRSSAQRQHDGLLHGIIQPGKWSTRKNARGDTEWIPPPHLDRPTTNQHLLAFREALTS